MTVGMAGAAAVRVLYAHLPLRSWMRYRIVVCPVKPGAGWNCTCVPVKTQVPFPFTTNRLPHPPEPHCAIATDPSFRFEPVAGVDNPTGAYSTGRVEPGPILLLCGDAFGAGSPTVIVSVAEAHRVWFGDGMHTLYVNVSTPVNPGLGVYVYEPFEFHATDPFAGFDVCANTDPAGYVSFAAAFTLTGVFSIVVAASFTASGPGGTTVGESDGAGGAEPDGAGAGEPTVTQDWAVAVWLALPVMV